MHRGDAPPHRAPRARPGARRRPRARIGHAARRRAGHGQEHAAAAGARAHGRAGRRCLLVTAEESSAQVRMRAERLGALAPNLLVVAETSLPHVRRARRGGAARRAWRSTRSRPSSIPTSPVRPVRSRRCATARTGSCSRRRSASWPRCSSGHVTKDGALAGPRVLEHVVDTVLSFDGDRGHALRMLHALKHRFGEHARARAVRDDRRRPRSTCPTRRRASSSTGGRACPGPWSPRCSKGARPLLVEVQALVVRRLPCRRDGRRRASIRPARACCSRCSSSTRGVQLGEGRRLRERRRRAPRRRDRRRPRARARGRERAAPATGRRRGTVAVGEVGLGGEVRAVPQLDRRLAEAARLGFTRAIAPPCRATRADSTVCTVVAGARRRRGREALVPARLTGLRVSCVPWPRGDREDEPVVPAQPRSEAMMVALRLVAPGTPAARRARPHPAGAHGRAHRGR